MERKTKKNYYKPRKISDFLIETENQQNENKKSKITTKREIFASFIIISELSNGAEILKRKIEINRETFQIFKIINRFKKLAD